MLSATKEFLTRPSTTKTYYVSTSGSDANNGLSTAAPFATVAAALAAAPAGSNVLLKRGGIWTPEVDITANGITLGAYDTGNLPVIDRGTEPTGGIFNDGFESETSAFTTNWGGKTEAGGSTATLETTNPVRGTQSLKYTHATGGSAYLSKTFTGAGEVYVQFKVDLRNIVNGAAFGEVRVFELAGGFIWVYICHDATPDRGLQVRFLGGDIDINAPTYYQQGQTLRIEIRYKKGTGTDSVAQCWVNGNLIASDLASTDTGNATGFKLGVATSGAGGLGAASQLVFDEVKVSTTALGVGTRGDVGITVEGNDCIVQDLEVRNSNQYLIKLRNNQRTTVRRCSLHDSNQDGIISNIGGGNHSIDNCEVWFTGGDLAAYGEGNGIQFLGTTTGVNTVRDCFIHHCGDQAGDHGIYSESGTNIFINNRFYGISGFGVKCLYGSAGTLIARNRMEFCRTGAVLVDSDTTMMPNPVLIYNNSTYLCGVYPTGLSPYVVFWVAGYGKARIVNNIASGGATGIEVEVNGDLPVSDTNDIFFGNFFGYWKADANQDTLADWRTTTSGLDLHSIESDPLYTNPDAGDLTLQSGSPAKNMGTSLPGISDTHLGSGPDLGYLEAG